MVTGWDGYGLRRVQLNITVADKCRYDGHKWDIPHEMDVNALLLGTTKSEFSTVFLQEHFSNLAIGPAASLERNKITSRKR
jgi:hypothetical protein